MNERLSRDRVVEQIVGHLLLMGGDVDNLAGAAAVFNRLNRTDLRALQLLRGAGLTAGELARALHITSGATTRVIDSLAGSGHVIRTPDTEDRRRVLVRLTPEAVQIVDRMLAPLRKDLRAALDSYAGDELEALARFLADARSLLRTHAARMSRPQGR